MSSIITIYDRTGASQICVDATQRIITKLADTRRYTVLPLSQTSLTRSDPHSLVVIPGGSYIEMARSQLPEEAARIQALVRAGTSFLGICAGAIAASQHSLLMKEAGDSLEFFSSDIPVHLNLYSGYCALAEFPGSSNCGVQTVRSASLSVPLFFKRGVFFPFREDPTINPLFWYENRLLHGQWRYEFLRDSTPPVAAVAARCGAARVVLSGLHPELEPVDISKVFPDCKEEIVSIPRTVEELTGTEALRAEVMGVFLQELNITLKV